MKDILRQNSHRVYSSLVLYAAIGALIGYTILHPASLLILGEYGELIRQNSPLWKFVVHSFARDHFSMSMYFALLGMFVGGIYGFMAYKSAGLLEQVRALSIQDELTGLYNRRYFFMRLKDETSRAERYHHPLSMIMLDIDHFKQINDHYGHKEGDAVLAVLGRFLHAAVRNTDVAARYGGEEFLVLMPETNRREALALAEWMREHIASGTIGTDATRDDCITVSAGVASFPGDADDSDTLLLTADFALYRAKNAGRNRVYTASKNDISPPAPPRIHDMQSGMDG